jgi:hypothetical protein
MTTVKRHNILEAINISPADIMTRINTNKCAQRPVMSQLILSKLNLPTDIIYAISEYVYISYATLLCKYDMDVVNYVIKHAYKSSYTHEYLFDHNEQIMQLSREIHQTYDDVMINAFNGYMNNIDYNLSNALIYKDETGPYMGEMSDQYNEYIHDRHLHANSMIGDILRNMIHDDEYIDHEYNIIEIPTDGLWVFSGILYIDHQYQNLFCLTCGNYLFDTTILETNPPNIKCVCDYNN